MRVIRASQMHRCSAPERALANACAESSVRTIGGVTVELRTNVPGLAAHFDRRYSDHPPTGGIDFTFVAFQHAGGYTFGCDHDGGWSWPHGALPVEGVAFLADAAAIAALVHYDPQLASLHGAAVESHGVSAAIAADSQGGKTTTALACARAGMRVYSDERVLLRENLVLPFLRRCRVRKHSAQLLCRDADDELSAQLQREAELSWIDVFGAASIANPAPLGALFIVAGKGRAAVAPCSRAEALRAVSPHFDARAGPLERIARVHMLLQTVHCYKLTLGTPSETAAAVCSALERVAAA